MRRVLPEEDDTGEYLYEYKRGRDGGRSLASIQRRSKTVLGIDPIFQRQGYGIIADDHLALDDSTAWGNTMHFARPGRERKETEALEKWFMGWKVSGQDTEAHSE